jgi:hypothetical protein
VGSDKETIKRMFPNLAKEIDSGEQKVSINSVRTNNKTAEHHVTNGRFVNYVPDVVDFIRRCDTDKQAEEIIAFEEKRGEIDAVYARRLRKQLKEKGVRSFGSKKDHDYYLKNGDV